VELPRWAQTLAPRGRNALVGLWRAAIGGNAGVAKRTVLAQLFVTLVPALFIAALLSVSYRMATAPEVEASTAGLIEAGGLVAAPEQESEVSTGLIGAQEESGIKEPSAESSMAPAAPQASAEVAKAPQTAAAGKTAEAADSDRLPVPLWLWITFGVCMAIIALVYWLWSWERLEVFKMLLTSFFPLALMILAVLGSIVFGLATPSEAAAIGGFGGFILAGVYRFIAYWREGKSGGKDPGKAVWSTVKELGVIVKESSFLTAKTSAMVCWLFVGSGIFSAAFALLGGQEVIEKWVLSLNMTPVQFMILAQFIIFILGWPLEWTEIIIIFMPIFLPLLPHFHIDPLFFGLLVALNLQTAFLSPPVAMAAFYLKGVSPPHVTLNAIFAGMMPFMGIQLIALVLLYLFPGIGLWLPQLVYGR
jgi:TRAP-type mannitol/chloroaromatic compound transport system permease large subunit